MSVAKSVVSKFPMLHSDYHRPSLYIGSIPFESLVFLVILQNIKHDECKCSFNKYTRERYCDMTLKPHTHQAFNNHVDRLVDRSPIGMRH